MDEAMKRLEALIEVEEDVRFWGKDHRVTPRLLPEVYGAGDHLLAFQPLNTRPNYYVIIVDASWLSSDDDDAFYEAFDNGIELGLLTHFSVDAYDDDGNEIGEEDRDTGWPVLNLDSGWSTWTYPVTPEMGEAMSALQRPKDPS